jgi:hypothetical protein
VTDSSPIAVGAEPFESIPHWLLYERGLSGTAIRLYLILRRHRNYETGQCWPGRKRLADLAETSIKTIDRAIARLAEVGAISIIKRKKRDGSPDSNLYVIHWHKGGRDRNDATLGTETSLGVGTKTTHEQRPIMNKDVPQWIQEMEDGPEFDAAFLAFQKGRL